MQTRRRDLLGWAAGGSLAAAPPLSILASACRSAGEREAELHAEVVVLGGGLGGCAAALAACRRGRSVVLVEPDLWLGGQLTSQAVPADENSAIETGGSTASYRELRERVRAHYRDDRNLTPAARGNARLNPGGGFVSHFCCDPLAALAGLDELLAPHVEAGRLRLLLEHELVRADLDGDRVRAVVVRDASGNERAVRAPVFLEATEEGEGLPLMGLEHVIGAEGRDEHDEPSAPEVAAPLDQQAITWCFAMDHRPGEDHVGDAPEGWERWGRFVPELTPPWPGPLLSLVGSHPVTLEPRQYGFVPPERGRSAPRTEHPNLFAYRQILNPEIHADGSSMCAVTLVNWPQNDAMVTPLFGPGIGPEERARALREAREVSLCLLHWLRTECPRPDGGQGWPGLALRGDLLGTEDGLARRPYIREARRMRARFTVAEPHVSPALRPEVDGTRRAARFEDSVGIGHYRIDLHPSTSGRNYVDLDCLPFEVPFGALLPQRVENVLAAGKCMGSTHITNGAYRLHPVEWGVGEAAGAAAALAVARGELPGIHASSSARLQALQEDLTRGGALLRWP
jgi:hypothetical protein